MAQRFRHASARSITAVVAVVASISALVPALLITNASATDPDTPTRIIFSTQPGDGDPGTAFVQPVVTLQKADPDHSGQFLTANSSDTVSLTLQAQTADTDGTYDPGTYVTGALSSSCSGSNSGGVVTFSGCEIDSAGKYKLTATDTTHPLTVQSSAFYISGAAELVFTTQPGGGAAGTSWDTQPVVRLRNAKGQLLSTGANQVGIAIKAGTGAAGAVLTCDKDGIPNNVIHFAAGIADFTNCAIDKPGSSYQLYAVDKVDQLVSAPTSAFGIDAGDFAQLAFTTQPNGAFGGAALTQQPAVTFEDAGGNPVTDDSTDSVVLSVHSTTSTGGTLSCPSTTATASAGVATFADCKLDKAGDYVLRATSGSTHVDSQVVTVAPGAAANIAFTTSPSGASPGTAFTGQPVVRLTDLGGNAATGSVQLSIKSGTGTSGAALTCLPVAAVSGNATFSNCRIDKAGNDYKLTATSGSLTADSALFNVATGTAAALEFTQTPGTGNDGGSAFPTQPRVKIKDAGGFAVTNGSVDLSIESGTGTPDAALSCDSTSVNANGSGIAVFSGCSIDKAGHGYRLRATLTGSSGSGAIVATSDPFDVGIGSPVAIVFSKEPDAGTGGVAFPKQPVITVEDAGGNPVSDATGDVTLGLQSATSDGNLSCQDATIPVQDSRAFFAGCSIDKAGGDYQLTASWNSHHATSDAFAITAGPATGIVFSRQPGGAVAGIALTHQPTVRFVDAGGNTATSESSAVTLAIASGSGAAGAVLSGCSGSTSNGIAAISGCAINTKGGGYVLRASSADGLCVDSLPFSVIPGTTTAGAASYVIPTAETFGGNVYGANPTKVVDDVNTGTGSLTFASTDLRVAGIGKPLLVARTYNSADATGGFFGRGWSSLFDVGVTMNATKTSAIVRGEDGQQTVWTWNARTATFVAPPGARGSLDCGGKVGNHCRFTRPDGSMWDVNYTAPGGGQLQTYKATDGYGLTFAWANNHVTITVTSTTLTPYQVVGTIVNGRITHLQTPAGRTVDYTYSGGLLSSVTDTAGRTWTYTYGAAGRLTNQSAPGPQDRLEASYDGAGRVTHVSAMGTSVHTDDDFGYDTLSNTTTRTVHEVVNGTPTTAAYLYKYKNNSLIAETTPSGACTRYSYDGKGNLILTVDPLGWATTLGYNAGNDLTSETTPLNTVSMTYDSLHRILTRKDANGFTTTYTYNGPFLQSIAQPVAVKGTGITTLGYNNRGLLTLVTGPLGKQSYGYDAFGNRTSSHLLTLGGVALDGPGTASTYDEAGRRLTSTDADGRQTVTTYDAAGDKLSMQNADGQVTTYQYTGAGDLKKVVTPTHTTEYSWDEGSTTETTTTDGSASSQVFDASGHLLRELAGTTVTKTNDYDASGRLVQQTDSAGITTRYTYDANSNPVLVTSSAGDVMSRQYDALNHPIRQVLDGAVTKTTYDATGNMLSKTDPSGHVTRYTYTPANEIKTVMTSAGTTTYTYDLDGNLTSLTDPRSHKTTYTYDAANRRTSTTVAGNTTSFGYDNASNVVSQTDPDGRQTTFTLDALNRAVKTTYSQNGSSFEVTQQYDGDGRRVKMVDPTGTHDYTYDAAGNLTAVTYNGDTFSYDYGTAGKIVETYPDGTKVTFGVDDARNVMSVESGTKGQPDYLHVAYMRNAQRFTTGIASSNGVLETRQLDQAGHVLDQQLSVGGVAVADDSYIYDAAGERLKQVNNVAGNVTTDKYAYDGAGRLTGFSSDSSSTDALAWPAQDVSAPVPSGSGDGVTPPIPASVPVKPHAALNPAPGLGYGYDENGNRSNDKNGSSFSYDAADELTSTSAGGQKSMTYDKSGNLTSVTDNNGTETFTYDAASRLVGVHLPSGSDISYTYDGDGLRVSKTVDSHTTNFVWDPASATPQLAIERRGNGDLIRRYFYGDGPVAMQTPDATYFYHLDPQGTVLELTDSSGNLAAAYHYDGFGALKSQDGPAAADLNPLRFQAGYQDSDTGLYNLGARNYDASLGRFTQRDPVERPTDLGYVSSYAFVDDRPTLFIDPTGEFEAQDVFWSHNTIEANVAMLTSYAITAGKVIKATGTQIAKFAEDPSAYLEAKWNSLQELGTTIKGKIGEFGDYLKEKLSSSVSSAEEEIAGNIGGEAAAESEAAVEVLERSGGEIAELGAEAGEVAGESAEVLAEAGEAAKFGGIALAVVGIGLQTFITVEDCMHDTVTKCVADAVGLAVAVGFIIGCEAASLGSLTPVCGIVGALISVGLTEIISRYGPQIAAAFVTGYEATVAGLTTAGEWIADTGKMIGDQIVTGYNTAITALKSGFDDAINTLVNAGYSAEQLALSLVNSFNEGLNVAVNALVGFGYDVADIATAIYNDFTQSVGTAVQALKDAYAFTVTAISNAVVDAFNATAEVLGQALKDAQYAVDQVAAGLKSAYQAVADWTDAAVASVLKGLDYGVNAIASALQDVYNDLDDAAATILKGLDFAVDAVAGALQSFYQDLDNAAAAALNAAGYVFSEIATGLKDIYNDAAAITASILNDIGNGLTTAVNDIAGALQSVYNLAAAGTAQILKDLSYGATIVAGALKDAYDAVSTAISTTVTNALYAVGYVVNDVADAITTAFTDLATDAQEVANLLYGAGYALVDVGYGIEHFFASADEQLVQILDTVSGSLNAAAQALQTVLTETVQQVAQAIKDAAIATIDQIADVLDQAFNYAADAAAAVLQGIGASVEDMVRLLDSVWNTAQSTIVSILNGLGADLTALKDAFVSLFGSTVQEIEDIFSAGGVLASAIQTLGDAFTSFGDAIASGVEDAWDTFTSWF